MLGLGPSISGKSFSGRRHAPPENDADGRHSMHASAPIPLRVALGLTRRGFADTMRHRLPMRL
jgi:hypothetical protein